MWTSKDVPSGKTVSSRTVHLSPDRPPPVNTSSFRPSEPRKRRGNPFWQPSTAFQRTWWPCQWYARSLFSSQSFSSDATIFVVAQNVCLELLELRFSNVDAPCLSIIFRHLNNKNVFVSFCKHRPFIDNAINVIVKM